jgi:hypothetical protein
MNERIDSNLLKQQQNLLKRQQDLLKEQQTIINDLIEILHITDGENRSDAISRKIR